MKGKKEERIHKCHQPTFVEMSNIRKMNRANTEKYVRRRLEKNDNKNIKMA